MQHQLITASSKSNKPKAKRTIKHPNRPSAPPNNSTQTHLHTLLPYHLRQGGVRRMLLISPAGPTKPNPYAGELAFFLKTNFESKYLLFTGMPMPDQRLVIMASPPRRFHRVATLGSAHMRSGCYVSGSAPINVPRGIVLPLSRYDHMLPIAGHWTAIEIRRSYR